MPQASNPPQKESSTSRIKQIAERALDELSRQLEAGVSEQLDAYLKAMGRFHQYSFNNLMLILSQRPDASRVAGFHTWRKLGRSVNRGEKGIAIFAPMKFKPDQDQDRRDDTKDKTPKLFFRVVYVFDISQTDGDELPEHARVLGDPAGCLNTLREAARASGISIEYADHLGGTEGYSTGGRIMIKAGLPPAEDFAVLAHEWAHEILHQYDRDYRPNKTVRETEAEAVAFVVCQGIGLNTNTASSDYIRIYDGDAETLAASLERVQKAACLILTAIKTPEAATTQDQAQVVLPRAIASRRSR